MAGKTRKRLIRFAAAAGVLGAAASMPFVLHGSAGDPAAPAARKPAAAMTAAAPAAAGLSAGGLRTLIYDKWQLFTKKDGLPSSECKAVSVDGDRVWVGTDEGLACYERGKFRAYGVKDGLPHRIVLSLAVDPGTRDLWVGTCGGLGRLSGGKFEHFNQLNSGLVNDVVYGLVCYKGEVWCATASGVSRFNPKTRQWSIYDHNNTIMFEPWCYGITAKDDMIYVGVWGGGLVEYSLKTGFWKDYHDPDGEMEICLFKDAGLVHEVVPAVSFEQGMVWAGTYFGLSTYDGRHWKNYFKVDSGLPSDFINFVRANGKVGWICTDDGVAAFDGATWASYRFVPGGGEVKVMRGKTVLEKRRLPATLPGNYCLGIDFQGDDVWVATASGLAHGRPGAAAFNYVRAAR